MSNITLKQKWKKWYPKEIFFRDIANNHFFLSYLDKFKKEDFCENSKHNKTNNVVENNINLENIESYEKGFQKGLSKNKESNILLKNKLNSLLKEFETALSMFENVLCSRLLKTVLIVSSYVIGKKTNIDELILVKHIKKIIKKKSIFLIKPQIIIHSNNKILIETILKDFLKTHKWEIICDDSIDLNGCIIKSKNGDIDTTIDARWQELCRLFYAEEY